MFADEDKRGQIVTRVETKIKKFIEAGVKVQEAIQHLVKGGAGHVELW